MSDGLITALTVIGVLLVIGLIIYAQVRRSIRRFARNVFNTDTLSEGLKNQQKELADTPCSVSAMTKVYLPQILRDFNDFNYEEFKQKAENIVLAYLGALETKKNINLPYAGKSLIEQVENEIENLKSLEYSRKFTDETIHRTEISSYIKRNGLCTVVFQSSVGFYDYTTNNSGAVVKGSKDLKRQTIFETELVYIQDASKLTNSTDKAIGITCPSCGAPVSTLGAKHCEFCGCAIKEINIYSWSFNSVGEK